MVGSVSVHPCVCVCVCVFFCVFFCCISFTCPCLLVCKDELDLEKQRAAKTACLSVNTPFCKLLPGAKKCYLSLYKTHAKTIILTRVPCLSLELHGSCFWQIVAVTVMLGIKTTVLSFQGADSLICNLQQNPLSRPIVGRLCPTFLKSGCMWLLLPGDSTSDSERWLTAKDKVVFCMLFFGVFSFCSLLA